MRREIFHTELFGCEVGTGGSGLHITTTTQPNGVNKLTINEYAPQGAASEEPQQDEVVIYDLKESGAFAQVGEKRVMLSPGMSYKTTIGGDGGKPVTITGTDKAGFSITHHPIPKP